MRNAGRRPARRPARIDRHRRADPQGAIVDRFDAATLGPNWQILAPDPTRWSLTEQPGALRLTRRAATPGKAPTPPETSS
ncbi:hypothetical protein ACQPYK_32395 [Streptosporangium sp. CA-135522]|uniref:beta-xylosidase family glycoside hydrolase n=1 Tax=Streptosporangium sp. CA-135522 TaxID=3240072 RepID=UPI003D9361A3